MGSSVSRGGFAVAPSDRHTANERRHVAGPPVTIRIAPRVRRSPFQPFSLNGWILWPLDEASRITRKYYLLNVMRDDFSPEVKRSLAARVGFRCSYCDKHTSRPQVESKKAVNLGVAA